jgi:hypothetical protein
MCPFKREKVRKQEQRGRPSEDGAKDKRPAMCCWQQLKARREVGKGFFFEASKGICPAFPLISNLWPPEL